MHHHPGLFWSREEKKKKGETQRFPGSRNQSHSCLCFSGKRGLVPTIRNYQEENMKYLALSSPSSPLYFPAQTSSGKKKKKSHTQKKWKMAESLQCVFLPMIIWMLLSGGGWARKHHMQRGRSGWQDFPSGGRDDTRRGGTWDLIYAPWKSGEQNGLGRGLV